MAMTALHRDERRRYFSSAESRRAWIAIGLVLAWCSVFYFMRQPQAPFAFDLPQAQTNSFLPGAVPQGANPWAVSNAWLSAYPTSLINCGSAGWSRCSNYCDQNSLVRYTECSAP
jgi:hypothetical protein